RSERDLLEALDGIREAPGLVLYTLVDAGHRARLAAEVRALGCEAIPVLDPLIASLARFLGRPPQHRPGMQHRVDDDYFRRIAALDFAITHDDGALGERLRSAEVILAGVSRTSKTPTCIYLAHRGVKAANVPLLPQKAPDPALLQAMAAGTPVIGLTASPTRLGQIRSQRLVSLGDRQHDYADLEHIRAEVADSRLFFQTHGIPIIDVTRRSIEETAAEILAIMRARSSEERSG
ncbi:MAG: pyruvate, water dikinase regulatory protein, partial [Pseudomonadota bacterium]